MDAFQPGVNGHGPASSGVPIVEWLDAGGQVRALPIGAGGVTVGRAAGNGIELPGDEVARFHLQIGWDGSRVSVTDLGTRSGTRLNGVPLQPNVAQPWDWGAGLEIGPHRLRLSRQAAATPAAAPAALAPSGSAMPSMSLIELRLEPGREVLELTPGQPTSTRLTLLNRSANVEDVRMAVEGVPAEWVTFSPPQLRLSPNVPAAVTLTVQVPRSSSGRAGEYPVQLQALSVRGIASRAARWEVAAFSDYSLEVVPARATVVNQQETSFRVLVRNSGNATASYQVRAGYDEPGLSYRLSRSSAIVEPGQELPLQLTVQPRERASRREQSYTFGVDVATAGAETQVRTLHLVQRRRLPLWWIPAIAAVLLAAFFLGRLLGLELFNPRGSTALAATEVPTFAVPIGETPATATPTQTTPTAALPAALSQPPATPDIAAITQATQTAAAFAAQVGTAQVGGTAAVQAAQAAAAQAAAQSAAQAAQAAVREAMGEMAQQASQQAGQVTQQAGSAQQVAANVAATTQAAAGATSQAAPAAQTNAALQATVGFLSRTSTPTPVPSGTTPPTPTFTNTPTNTSTPTNTPTPVTPTLTSTATPTITPSPTLTPTPTRVPQADLRVTVAGSANPVLAGSVLTYTIQVENRGPDPASGVRVTDRLPVGVDLRVASLSQTNGWECRLSGANEVVCTDESLPSRTIATLTLAVTVQTSSGTIVNNVAVDSSTNDPDRTNNLAVATTNVSISADLSVSITGEPATVGAGQPLTYTLSIGNSGPDPATLVNMAATLPDGVTNITILSSVGWSCTVSGRSVSCSRPNLILAQTSLIQLRANAPLTIPAGGRISADASVTGTTIDPNTTNNSSTATLQLVPAADLSVSYSAEPERVFADQSFIYRARVSNNGPSPANNVDVTLSLPTGLLGVTFISSTPGAPECNRSGGQITCRRTTLDPGNTYEVAVNVRAPLDGATLNSTAAASSAALELNPANNSASTQTIVDGQADLVLSVTDSPDPVANNSDLFYTIRIQNNGPSPATNLRLVNTLPSNLTLAAMPSGGGWGCTESGGIISCNRGELARGAVTFLTIWARTPATVDAAGIIITNRTTLSTDTSDPSPLLPVEVTTNVQLQPIITTQPVASPAVINSGDTTTLSVGATGTNLTYQWFIILPFGGASFPVGSGSPTLSQQLTAPPGGSFAYRYWVRITNDVGSVDSTQVLVQVNGPPLP